MSERRMRVREDLNARMEADDATYSWVVEEWVDGGWKRVARAESYTLARQRADILGGMRK